MVPRFGSGDAPSPRLRGEGWGLATLFAVPAKQPPRYATARITLATFSMISPI